MYAIVMMNITEVSEALVITFAGRWCDVNFVCRLGSETKGS